jgi:hypothetical protein
MSTELVFLVEEAPDGGYTARALGQAIFTNGETPEQIIARHLEISKSELIEKAAVERLREQQFVDDGELAEIEVNERLVARLKEGSLDARARRGRFVG